MGKWLEMAINLEEDKKSPKRVISTPAKPAKGNKQRRICFWLYKLNENATGFIQMGLMTDDPIEAQRQLTEIYGKPVMELQPK